MTRKILGTRKFSVYFFNGKNVNSGTIAEPKHFIFNQWGRIYKLNEDGKIVDKGTPFRDYGEMITMINNILREDITKNLRSVGTLRKLR